MSTTLLNRPFETSQLKLIPVKVSPLLQLAAARVNRGSRDSSPAGSLEQRRRFLAEFRASELAAWEASGGDFLRTL